MTNKEYYIKVKKVADNKPEGMGIKQFSDLILDIMPRAAWDAKYRPDDIIENEVNDSLMEEYEKPKWDISAKEDFELRL